jgi:hypothetical protein
MHIDVAKKSGDALEREGRLPQQWEEENTKLKEKLDSIREHGTADARYSEPSPVCYKSYVQPHSANICHRRLVARLTIIPLAVCR